MLQKWKTLISHWISCYFNDEEQKEKIDIDILVTIISHLRQNLNLDESKSSKLRAHTVKEFILEKYPQFRFENGTLEVTSEDEVYLVASLLLFFVCTNAKETDIKSAMCSRLSTEDQKTILNYSKCLMECPAVMFRDVQNAISEACGQDTASIVPGQASVAETPPALRSLHSEVRRLQASLDAERFDRNYLQEELARTNLKMEKLMKDKEQYKLEIMDLKAKISLCSHDDDSHGSSSAEMDKSTKLTKQLKEIEDRLEYTQGQLDDVVHERDVYKKKVEDLKKERDKWILLSEQESNRILELTEELETERRNAQALRDVVAELRQHNRRNGLDSSQLECDDPDASIQSLQHNISVCSEACANVVEVQLGEERAKIVVLKQQNDILQAQINDLMAKATSERQSYESSLNYMECEVNNLKQRINEVYEENLNLKCHVDEEINKRNTLKEHFSNEVIKLNNQINELGQILRDNQENSRKIIESKIDDIKRLQEEKESLNNELSNCNNFIVNLKSELDVEKCSKTNMKDSYENKIMKLNEKVVKRNNELVELQNNICEKSEMIESLHLELIKEKEHGKEFLRKYDSDVTKLVTERDSIKTELADTKAELEQLICNINEKNGTICTLMKELDSCKEDVNHLTEKCLTLETANADFVRNLESSNNTIKEVSADLRNLQKVYTELKQNFHQEIDEKNATLNALQKQLENEIEFKISLQNNLTLMKQNKISLEDQLNNLKNVKHEKDDTVKSLENTLQNQISVNESLTKERDKLGNDLERNVNIARELTNLVESLRTKLETEIESFNEQLNEKSALIEELNSRILDGIQDKYGYEDKIKQLKEEREHLIKENSEKSDNITQLQAECAKLTQITEQNKNAVKTLEQNIQEQNHKCLQLGKNFDASTTKMVVKLNETEKVIRELCANSKKAIKDKENHIQVLNCQIKSLEMRIEEGQEAITKLEKEKIELIQILEQEKVCKAMLEKDYKEKCVQLEAVRKVVDEKSAEITKVNDHLRNKETEIKHLQNKINDLESFSEEVELELRNEIDCNKDLLEALRKENEQLLFTIEEDNSKNELLIKEKDKMINDLETQIRQSDLKLESLKKMYEDLNLSWEKLKADTKEDISTKDRDICKLNEEINTLRVTNEDLRYQLKESIVKNKNDMASLSEAFRIKDNNVSNLEKDKSELIIQLNEEKALKDVLLAEKNTLLETNHKLANENTVLSNDKAILTQELSEERNVRNIITEEKNALQNELCNEVATIRALLVDKECLTQQLVEEKSLRELVENEKHGLIVDLDLKQQKIDQIIKDSAKEQNELTNENHVLIEKVSLLENEISVLVNEYNAAKSAIDALQREKDVLDKELKDIKHHAELVLKQKDNIAIENNNLLKEVTLMEQSINNLMEEKNALITIKEQLLKEKQELHKELLKEEHIKNELIREKNNIEIIKDTLVNDRDSVLSEKQVLLRNIDSEKAAKDELESEKDKLQEQFKKFNEKYNLDIKHKNDEVLQLESKLNKVVEEFQNELVNNQHISSIIDSVFEKVMSNLTKEEINNEVLQKLLNGDHSNITFIDKCDILSKVVETLSNEVSVRVKLEKMLADENSVLSAMQNQLKQKEVEKTKLESELNKLLQTVNEIKLELTKQAENYATSMNSKIKDIQTLQQENQALNNDLNDVKLQLEIKVHSLKEKLVDNENVTDKLKHSYECQIDNLNLMITKLTCYLKEKTVELEGLRKDKEQLTVNIEENQKTIKSLEEEVKAEKQKQEKLINDFESERLVLKNMVTVTESVMEDQKISFTNIIGDHIKTIEDLQTEVTNSKESAEKEKVTLQSTIKEQDITITSLLKELSDTKEEKDRLIKHVDIEKQELSKKMAVLTEELRTLECKLQQITSEKNTLEGLLETCNKEKEAQHNVELRNKHNTLEKEFLIVVEDKQKLETERTDLLNQLEVAKNIIVSKERDIEEINELKTENVKLTKVVEENETVITNLEQLIKHELEQNQKLRVETFDEKVTLTNKFILLQEYRKKAEIELDEREKEINSLKKEIEDLKAKVSVCEHDLNAKDGCISKITKEKDAVISAITKELLDEKTEREKCQQELEVKSMIVYEMKQNLEDLNRERDVLHALRKENEELMKVVQEGETLLYQERASNQKYPSHGEKDHYNQVDKESSSNTTQSSSESIKTITDLEKIIHDKNRTITTLQSDITFLKTIVAESETKLLDVTKELDISKENCQQLSNQLKKIVFQKNEEIAELKKQVNKMSATENRASQIIKVSAKYQAIILKRIAEIKSNTVLKELTNYGNSNGDNELRRSLNAGTITMEDLENFLETTDRHLKRCSEKQLTLQKERDRLYEVNRIHESEIINLKKFLTELSVSFQTFNSVKDLYMQKLSRVVSVQRTVRREILNLDGQVTDTCMCRLERGYAAVMQDLSECAMNLERWVERCVSRSISVEKIKQALSDCERVSLAGASFQNTGLEVQLEELEKSFQKLLEEVARAQRGEGARDAQAVTVMEVKAEYEDKLNRMKAKMKQLFNEQMLVIKEKQREEIAVLEQELEKARETLAKTSRNYEEHIRKLTTELWTVGEKFLMTKDEADWLKRKQRSGSLMSLQQVHSSGLVPPLEEVARPSDTLSLRSLPTHNDTKTNKEGRGLHMSDEEGEVFDNRWLKELAATPRRETRDTLPPGQRLSELKWRNSLCPPHLKSSYPAETQFAPALDEEDIKCLGTNQAKQQRKEVGITAYKKPGPPTPSKQAGRLSATDSELRESLRVEGDPHASRKTSTPSRLRSLFRSSKTETAEGTPRSRRLSNIFRKK